MTEPEANAPTATYEAIGRAFYPQTFAHRHKVLNALDPRFAQNWLAHIGRLFDRPQLDRRRRFLVLTGQFTMLGETEALRENLVAALAADVAPRELLEVIVQAYVYAGSRVIKAADVLYSVLDEQGLLDDFVAEQQVADGPAARSLDEERQQWSATDREDPRLPRLLDRYGWGGISTGLTLRPGHHIHLVATLDLIDPEFLQVWLDTAYENLYSRHVLDDATRLLCTVGDCFAVGENHQARRHMRAALRRGAQPRELLEVIFQTCAVVGHPHMLPLAVDDLITILIDEDRLAELVDGEGVDELRSTVAQRVARRDSIQDALVPASGS